MKQLEGKVILVTGANGFIGTHLSTRLSKVHGVKLLLLSRQARQSTNKNVLFLKSELSQLNPEFWHSKGIGNIDYVFHLGAFIPKITAEANCIKRAVDDNINGTRALLNSLLVKPDKIIFSSTIDVYAHSAKKKVLTENAKVAPSTLYGASKFFCENLVSAWAKERGCAHAILRYGHIYGPGEEKYGKLIPVVIRNLLANQRPIVHGDGSALRDYLYVGDAVEATLRAACVEGNIGPLNVVRGESVALKDVVQLLVRLVENNLAMEFLVSKPNGKSFRFDNSMMKKSLGNWLMTSLELGLAAEVDAFRKMKK